jgi:hypothetical protein
LSAKAGINAKLTQISEALRVTIDKHPPRRTASQSNNLIMIRLTRHEHAAIFASRIAANPKLWLAFVSDSNLPRHRLSAQQTANR